MDQVSRSDDQFWTRANRHLLHFGCEFASFVPARAQGCYLTALQSGEVDVLLRNTSWTLTRESNLGLMFAATNFWDSTGFMAKKASGTKPASELNNATICVRPGTSTEIDATDWTRNHDVKFTPVLIGDVNAIQQAFLSGRCDAYTTDSSQLAGVRFTQGANADQLLILPETVSPAQSGSMVRKGDDAWFDIVRWAHFAQVAGESQGVTSASVQSQLASTNPDIRRLLGVGAGLGKSLGLDDQWGYNVITQVGNYGEMYQRNIGPLGLPRGRNALATEGACNPPLCCADHAFPPADAYDGRG